MTICEFSIEGIVRQLMKVFLKSLPLASTGLHASSLVGFLLSSPSWWALTNQSLYLCLTLSLSLGTSFHSFLRG